MAGKYTGWLPTAGAPTRTSWLMNTNGRALGRQTAGVIDNLDDRLLQGMLARFPTKGSLDATGAFGPPPTDAIDEQAADRKLRRGPAESNASLGARVQNAWDMWPLAGGHYAILRQLQIAGYATMNVVQDNGRYAHLVGGAGDLTDLAFGTLMTCADRDGVTPGWMFDTRRGEYFSQFGILFTTDAANLQTAAGQTILNSIVEDWGPGDAIYVGAWVVLTGRLLGWPTTRTLGSGGTLGGASHRFIPGDGSPASVIGP